MKNKNNDSSRKVRCRNLMLKIVKSKFYKAIFGKNQQKNRQKEEHWYSFKAIFSELWPPKKVKILFL